MRRESSLCSIATSAISGWKAVTLENGRISVTVLPDKGADIYSFVDLTTGIDVLGKTPWGLQPAGAAPRRGSNDCKFLQNYEGAWQELFPNTLTACEYKGASIPFHGEVATLPWDLTIEANDKHYLRIALSVRCAKLPLSLTRFMSLHSGSDELIIDETVCNLSDERIEFVWGHHPLLGSPFLDTDCVIHADDCSVVTAGKSAEPPTATLTPSSTSQWPYTDRLDGSTEDLRKVKGPDAGTHDHAYLTDLKRGWIEVENPRLRLTFGLEWDPSIFRWLVNWRPFGGSRLAPLDGIYGMAIEPWSTQANLAAALAAGDALSLEGGQSLSTSLKARLRRTESF